MTAQRLELSPIRADELTTLFLEQTKEDIEKNRPFLRNTPTDGKGGYSLYGKILHLRGVNDAQLLKISEEEARGSALSGVATRYRQTLVDYGWQNTSHTRPDLVIARFAASMVRPRMILGHNAEVIITLGEMANNMSNERPPRIINKRDSSTEREARAYSWLVGGSRRGGGAIKEEDSKPTWYVQYPIRRMYAQFGESVAKVIGLAANEIQLLPELPLDPEHDKGKFMHTAVEMITSIAEHLNPNSIYFTHRVLIPNGSPRGHVLSLNELVRSTNKRLGNEDLLFNGSIPRVWDPGPDARGQIVGRR